MQESDYVPVEGGNGEQEFLDLNNPLPLKYSKHPYVSAIEKEFRILDAVKPKKLENGDTVDYIELGPVTAADVATVKLTGPNIRVSESTFDVTMDMKLALDLWDKTRKQNEAVEKTNETRKALKGLLVCYVETVDAMSAFVAGKGYELFVEKMRKEIVVPPNWEIVFVPTKGQARIEQIRF